MASELESGLQGTMDWGKKWLVDSSDGKTWLVSFDWSSNTVGIYVKMDGSVLEEKLSFKILGLTFSSKLDWGSYIISVAKFASKNIGALICSMKFLSPEVALYLYKSTIWLCMEYCSGFFFSLNWVQLPDAALDDLFFSKSCYIKTIVKRLWT